MAASRIRLGFGALVLALATGMLDAPQMIPWAMIAVAGFFIVWGIWPDAILVSICRLPYGVQLAENLNTLGEWMEGITSELFDRRVATELDELHQVGHETLSRHAIVGLNTEEWKIEAKEWMDRVEDYIAQNINRSGAYMFRTHSRTRPRQLALEMNGKLEKLRLINGRYVLRDNGTQGIH